MPITKIKILGVGGINSLELNFNPRVNIICGPNGIGKSTILDCIYQCVISQTGRIKRNARTNLGVVQIEGSVPQQTIGTRIELSKFLPDDSEHINGQHNASRWFVYFTPTRDIGYGKLNAIAPDPAESEIRQRFTHGAPVNPTEIKNWFIHRHLYAAHPDILSPAQLSNLQYAKELFNKLDVGFAFATVDVKKSEILVDSPTGRIPFEYLSSGFRSSLILIFGLIKEIEHRLPAESCDIREFGGVTLIDEIELHLHPNWQRKICGALTEAFPSTQFIVTTHSPHVIQSASPESVYALRLESDGQVMATRHEDLPFGFQGWTLEEILTYVMGVDHTTGGEFESAVKQFTSALSDEDASLASISFSKLDSMLHPSNVLRSIYKLQLADLQADKNDA